MLADSCEATVRSRKPTKKQEITDTVQEIIDHKIQTGQLDESGLTFNDVKAIRPIFVDMLQAVFHPRINYPSQAKVTAIETPRVESLNGAAPVERESSATVEVIHPTQPRSLTMTQEIAAAFHEDEDETPLPEVPPLPRTSEQRAVKLNGDERAKGSE
jgi:hypothetical protein